MGTKVSNTFQLLGKRIESTFEVTEHEPNRRVRYKALSGPIPFDALTTFEGVEGGTRVNIEVEADVGGVFKLAEPIVARTSQRQWENSFATLKDILEAG
ncbi:MAG: hypothetical protein ACE5M4_10510, partial [Anaerolineales bacterium]